MAILVFREYLEFEKNVRVNSWFLGVFSSGQWRDAWQEIDLALIARRSYQLEEALLIKICATGIRFH